MGLSPLYFIDNYLALQQRELYQRIYAFFLVFTAHTKWNIAKITHNPPQTLKSPYVSAPGIATKKPKRYNITQATDPPIPFAFRLAILTIPPTKYIIAHTNPDDPLVAPFS